jgi:hypothetical protein
VNKVVSNNDLTMFRLLAASWFTRRVAGPLSRAIPDPFLRAAAIAGTGILASRRRHPSAVRVENG